MNATASKPSARRAKPVETPSAEPYNPYALNYSQGPCVDMSEDKLVDLYKNALDSGNYAVWRFSDQSGHNSAGCHGYMHNAQIKKSWACVFRYGFNIHYRCVHGFDVKPEDIHPAYLWYINDFLLGENSPWKSLVDKLNIVRNVHGVPIMYVVDGPNKEHIDKHLLQNFNIASRWPVEFPSTTKEVFELKNSVEGVTNEEAIVLHYNLRYNPLLEVFMTKGVLTVGGYHHWLAEGWDFTRFIERKPNSLMAGHKRFARVDEAIHGTNDRYVWGDTKRNTQGIVSVFREGLHSEMKKITTRFGVSINVVTKEGFLKFLEAFRKEMRAILPKEAGEPSAYPPNPKNPRIHPPSAYTSFDSVYPHLKENA